MANWRGKNFYVNLVGRPGLTPRLFLMAGPSLSGNSVFDSTTTAISPAFNPSQHLTEAVSDGLFGPKV